MTASAGTLYTLYNDFTDEEKALIAKGAVMELYSPNEHSRHVITTIDGVKDSKTGKVRQAPSDPLVCLVFGLEDAGPAREEGRSMAEFSYSRAQAHEFLFAEGWDKYHDRFFTRAYVQEGEKAYEEALRQTRQR